MDMSKYFQGNYSKKAIIIKIEITEMMMTKKRIWSLRSEIFQSQLFIRIQQKFIDQKQTWMNTDVAAIAISSYWIQSLLFWVMDLQEKAKREMEQLETKQKMLKVLQQQQSYSQMLLRFFLMIYLNKARLQKILDRPQCQRQSYLIFNKKKTELFIPHADSSPIEIQNFMLSLVNPEYGNRNAIGNNDSSIYIEQPNKNFNLLVYRLWHVSIQQKQLKGKMQKNKANSSVDFQIQRQFLKTVARIGKEVISKKGTMICQIRISDFFLMYDFLIMQPRPSQKGIIIRKPKRSAISQRVYALVNLIQMKTTKPKIIKHIKARAGTFRFMQDYGFLYWEIFYPFILN